MVGETSAITMDEDFRPVSENTAEVVHEPEASNGTAKSDPEPPLALILDSELCRVCLQSLQSTLYTTLDCVQSWPSEVIH